MHKACAGGHLNAIKLLLQSGADPLCMTHSGELPWEVASFYDNQDCVEYLQNYRSERRNDRKNAGEKGMKEGLDPQETESTTKDLVIAALDRESKTERIAAAGAATKAARVLTNTQTLPISPQNTTNGTMFGELEKDVKKTFAKEKKTDMVDFEDFDPVTSAIMREDGVGVENDGEWT